MQAAADATPSGMVSVIGLDAATTTALCERATAEVRPSPAQREREREREELLGSHGRWLSRLVPSNNPICSPTDAIDARIAALLPGERSDGAETRLRGVYGAGR